MRRSRAWRAVGLLSGNLVYLAAGPPRLHSLHVDARLHCTRHASHPRGGDSRIRRRCYRGRHCAAAADKSLQFDGDACQNLAPIVVPALAEQACRRIPGAVVTIEEPAPIGCVYGNSSHTGLPTAPARWAIDKSIEITRSRHESSAAASEKSLSLRRKAERWAAPTTSLRRTLRSW